MTKLPRVAIALSSIALSSLALGCADDSGGSAAPGSSTPPTSAHARVGSFVMKVQPHAGRVDVYRLPSDAESAASGHGPLIAPENLDSLTIVATGTQPANTVDLITDQNSLVDTYGAGASGGCPAASFCADVALTHAFAGLNLSAVYVQVYALHDGSGQPLGGHDPTNGVSSTPFGIDLTWGAWLYTTLGTTLAAGTSASQPWVFENPDDAVTYIYLDTYAALYPMLWFDTSGITQTAPLVAGQPASVHYAYARNTGCRGSGWSMQGFYKGYNIDTHITSWTGNATDTFFDQYLIMPFGPGLDFWFNNTSSGCTSWDSNGGSNYNFSNQDTATRIHFAGPSASQPPYAVTSSQWYKDSGVGAGVTIGVDYELDRVRCGSLDQYGRVPSGVAVTMYYQLDGGSFTPVGLLGLPYDVPASINGDAGQVYVPPSIAIPSGSHKLTAYFDSTGPGCHNYDSNGGSNYTFNY